VGPLQQPLARVLVVDADDRTLADVRRALPSSWALEIATTGDAALAALDRENVDVVVSEAGPVGAASDEVLHAVRERFPDIPHVVLTRGGEAGTSEDASAAESSKRSGFGAIVRAADESELAHSLQRVVAERAVRRHEDGPAVNREPTVIGSSPPFLLTLDAADKVAHSTAPALIVGETGSGKDLLAARIHARGPRRHRPFIVVNLGAIPSALLDSELFGHVGGAFTGATRSRRGLIVEAEGGTLFLDEIADLPLELQGRLLRVLETGNVRAVGSDHERHVEVRFLAATQRPLAEAVRERRFREDLYFRLNVLSIQMPPLRERREDLPALIHYFFERAKAKNPRSAVTELSETAEESLCAADWPGNVRQLAAVIERAVVLGPSARIEVSDLEGIDDPRDESPVWPADRPSTLRALTDRYIEWVLARTNGDKARAAAILGVDPSTLYRWKRKQPPPYSNKNGRDQ
jgi:two-component system, NtrC family, response regulator HydG